MLRGSKVEAEERDLAKKPFTVEELKALFGKRPASDFLNARNEEAREKGWNKSPPPEEELLEAMAKNVNLIRRPILMVGKEMVLGFDEEKYKDLLK